MKTEVRFKNSGAIFEIVYHALRDRLANQTDPGVADAAPTAIDALHPAIRASVAQMISPELPASDAHAEPAVAAGSG